MKRILVSNIKKEDITFKELGRHLCIEEENRLNDHDEQPIMSSKINMVEEKKESNRFSFAKEDSLVYLQREDKGWFRLPQS